MSLTVRLMWAALLVAVFSGSALAAERKNPKSCAEYRATKRSFLVSEESVVGRSCEVAVAIAKTDRDAYTLRGVFDWTTVDSGSSLRDEHVAEHFTHEGRSEVLFESDPIPGESLRALAKGGRTTLPITGRLTVGGERSPIGFELSRTSVRQVRARAETSFPPWASKLRARGSVSSPRCATRWSSFSRSTWSRWT